MRKVDEEYFARVEAIEFAVKYDDGRDPRGITEADVVVLGVSRTGKTPLCMYLAHKRIKAANVPLVPEVPVPNEVFSVPSHRLVGLTIQPDYLFSIRQERLKTLGLPADAEYANAERIRRELAYAEDVMHRLGCVIIDVTGKAVEETASKVLEVYYRGLRQR
jgi:regulator of PEP synthase PpsR (kinase-PPPase family)